MAVSPDNNTDPQANNAGVAPEPQQSSYILICEPDQVTQILHQLLQLQTPLTLQLATADGVRNTQSTVLRIEQKSKPAYVVLHQPEHANWQHLLQDKPVTRITCNLPNGRLTFSTRLEPLDTVMEGSFFCRFPIPTELRKYQLRSSFRISVAPGTSTVTLPLADSLVGGECINVSIDGCCLLFQPNPGTYLEENSQISDLAINLGGMANLTVDVKVCRIATTRSGRLIVGAQYLDLTPQQQSQLQSALTQIQRQQLQKNIRLY